MLATLVLVGGCGDDDGGVCEPGSTQSCNCPGGGTGVQTCSNFGDQWGNCVLCDPCVGVVCGDGFCNTSCENSQNCEADCGGINPCANETCGNGYCHPDCEDNQNCPADCGGGDPCANETCGNGVCNADCGETTSSCTADCDTCSPDEWAECVSSTTARICVNGYWQYLDANDFNQLCIDGGYTDYDYGACEDDGAGNAFYVCCGECAGYGFECGSVQSDACSWNCGSCPSGETCDQSNLCQEQDPCVNETCGNGNCNAACGETSSNCLADCCTPDCTDKDCGIDGCGGVCGTCLAGEDCIAPDQQCINRSCGGFTEDFNDGVADGWIEADNANWNVVSGEYVTTPLNDLGRTKYSNCFYGSFRLSVDVNCELAGDPLQICYAILTRASGWSSAGDGSFDISYAFVVTQTGGWRFTRYSAGSGSIILGTGTSSAFNTGANVWNEIVIWPTGSVWDIRVNGTLIGTFSDNYVLEGHIALYGLDTLTRFDNINVQAL